LHPKVGGRLRILHEQNESVSIESEIYKYDGSLAVVIAKTRTGKGLFCGIGMSSVARDEKIAPAILEMAESRAIARSLRFAGFGVEYCGAEELSHLNHGNGNQQGMNSTQPQREYLPAGKSYANGYSRNDIGNNGNRGDNGNGNRRLTSKQYQFILERAEERNISTSELNQRTLELYGVACDYLNRQDASSFIQELQSNQGGALCQNTMP